MPPDLAIAIVTYEPGEHLAACLDSLYADPLAGAAEVLVVDNASTDGSTAILTDRFPAVRLVEMGRNAGFGAANNVALAASTARLVLMANPDTRLASGDLGSLVRYMDANPRVGLVGPRLLDEAGSLQRSICNYPTVLREVFECLFLHRVFPRLTGRFADVVQDPAAYAGQRSADWVSGAVMLARADALREVGGFDEDFFLYAEEVDLCRRLTDAGWQVRYVPEVAFLHVGGEYDADPFLALENQRSKLRYFLKHEGRAATLAFSAVIALRLTLRSAIWLAASIRRGGEASRRRARAALHTLRGYPRLVLQALQSPVSAEAAARDGRA